MPSDQDKKALSNVILAEGYFSNGLSTTSHNDQNDSMGLTRRNVLRLATVAAMARLGGADAALQAEEPLPTTSVSAGAKQRYDLSALKWRLSGYMPYMERGGTTSIVDIRKSTDQKIGSIPAPVPGSVQLALLHAGLIKDWNVGLNARDCQWVENLEEYVAWSQARQAAALGLAARTVRSRFPACGGLMVWMGHDAFPCTSNTSVIDFEGNLKPAGVELGKIYLTA